MIEEIKNWAGLAALLISLGTTVYALLTSKSRINEEHLRGVDNRMDGLKDAMKEHDRRIQGVEQELKHLPAKDDVNDLKIALAELRGTVGRLDENLTGVNRSMRRVEEWLMKEANK